MILHLAVTSDLKHRVIISEHTILNALIIFEVYVKGLQSTFMIFNLIKVTIIDLSNLLAKLI